MKVRVYERDWGDVEIIGVGIDKVVETEVPAGSTVTIKAWPKYGHRFYSWSDEDRSNPREIVVNSDIDLELWLT